MGEAYIIFQACLNKLYQIYSNSMSGLPEGWQERTSSSTGKTYYLNLLTKESRWERPTEPAVGFGDGKVQASHLLVKHCESRRPASWRSDKITRSKDEALQMLLSYQLSSLTVVQLTEMEIWVFLEGARCKNPLKMLHLAWKWGHDRPSLDRLWSSPHTPN